MGGSVQASETSNVPQCFAKLQSTSLAKPWYSGTKDRRLNAPHYYGCAAGLASSNGTYDM